MIAPGKVGTSDRSLEEHIPDLEQTGRAMIENHVTGRMAGTMQHLEFDLAESHAIPVLQPAIRLEVPDVRKTEHLALLFHALDPERILALRPFDRHLAALQQCRDTTGMIDMAMRHQNLDQFEPLGAQRCFNPGNIPTRVDNGRLTGFFTPEKCAVLFERRHGNNFVAHTRENLMKVRRRRIIARSQKLGRALQHDGFEIKFAPMRKVFSTFIVCATLLSASFTASAAEQETKPEENFALSLFQRYTNAAQDVILQGLKLVGVNYRLGGNDEDSGLDCSGFVRLVFKDSIGTWLPRTAREMSEVGERIDPSQLKPGDLVFFNTMRRTFSHVGIYLGDNHFLHAPRAGAEVRVENMNSTYWLKRFNGARRIIENNP